MFSARTDGIGAAVIHTFTGGEGDVLTPSGFLAEGDGRWIYGTSQRGGHFDWVPKVYRIHPEQDRFEVVADLPGRFRRESDNPCGLMRSRSGDFFGTTPRGGTANLGTLFGFSPATGQVTVLHEFDLTPDDRWRAWPELLEARDGFLYGLASGETTNQVQADGLFRLNPLTGEYRILATMDRSADTSLSIRGGLIETLEGDLFAVRSSSRVGWSDNQVLGEVLRVVEPGFTATTEADTLKLRFAPAPGIK
jgi:uncharacterized repeat protein (TIGR03803 family)